MSKIFTSGLIFGAGLNILSSLFLTPYGLLMVSKIIQISNLAKGN